MALVQIYRYRYSALIGILIGACCLPAWGLSLQEVELKSRLNQPLHFTLKIAQNSKTPISASQLQVRIASADVYLQSGLSHSALLDDIALHVVTKDGLQIQGRSIQRLRDPVLHLLFDLRWPEGSALVQRSVIVELADEYLADSRLPLLKQAKPVKKIVAAVQEKTQVQQLQVLDPYNGERIHHVRRGDVLSLVASEYRGTVNVPLHRYMRAIQRHNRGGFPQGLDQLSPGQVIRMPDPLDLLEDAPAVLPQHGQAEYIDYQVQYGDQLSLLAQHFRGSVDMPLKAYMQRIVDDNADVLDMSGASLKSGMILRIPHPMSPSQNVSLQAPVQELLAAQDEEPVIPVIEPVIEDASNAEEEPHPAMVEDLFVAAAPVPVNKNINAYVEAAKQESAAVDVAPVAKPVPPVVKKRANENSFRQWIIYALLMVVIFVVGTVIIAVIRGIKISPEPIEKPILPSLIPGPAEPPEEILGQGAMQERIATFSTADQNEVEKLMAEDDLMAAVKRVDQLIYTQSWDLKNWLLKLEILARQGNKERCSMLAKQVRRRFKSAEQQARVNRVLDDYFSAPVDAKDFVPEINNSEASRKKSAAAELASETAEVRVYLSYGFYDMAEQALNKLMQDFPRHMELRILNLEMLLGTGDLDELQRQSDALLQGAAQLSQAQEHQVQEILERVQEGVVNTPAPAMDLDLSGSSPKINEDEVFEDDVIDLELSASNAIHLDEGLDLEGDIADALHREEDAYHKAHDLVVDEDIELIDPEEIILDELD